jgi:hypothetical protein
MRDRCIQAVSQAIGRDITQAEAQNIEARILKNMRYAATKDPAGFQRLTGEQRLQEAAKLAATELVNEATLKKVRVGLTIKARDRLDTYIDDMKATGMDAFDALRRTLVFLGDGKSNFLSSESRGNAIRANAIRQMIDTFEAVDARIWGLFENQEGVRQLTKAMFGEQVADPKVAGGAKAWLDVAEQMRQQFNAAGGDIGRLENWALPQHHSQLKVGQAGRDKWVADIFPMLDRRKYINLDGSSMSDQEVINFLNNAYFSIATGGINKITPGAQSGIGMMANRNAESRSLHFRDADTYLAYQQQYGEKSLWDVMTGHVSGLAKEIAALETYGPNPHLMFRALVETHLKDQAMTSPDKSMTLQEQARDLQRLYDFVSGAMTPIVNKQLASSFDTLRNWLVASRLGSAVITALADEATVQLTARVNNLPALELFRNEAAAMNLFNRKEEALANRAGLALDTALNSLNRWGEDHLGNTWSNKMASTVMRASGLEALDGARRRAFGTTMMSALGEIAGKYGKLTDLDKSDYRILLSKGITEENFQTWKLAELERWGAGNGVLTPESIMQIPTSKLEAAGLIKPGVDIEAQASNLRRDAVIRLLGSVLEETDMAVIRPGAIENFQTGAGLERGTMKGELTRSFFLFKSFPWAMIHRHWMRGLGMETVGGKASYIASLIAATTVLGAVSQTVNDALSGKDPRNYNPFQGEHGAKNWVAAMLKGGSLGLYGDFLFANATQHSQTGVTATLLGPVAGLVDQAFALTQGNIVQAAQGKDTKFGGELVNFIKGNLPGGNLWYAKAGLDHLIFNQLSDYFSPGYLRRVQDRARKDFGQEYFWRPNQGFGDMRAPNFNRIVGQ